MRMFTYVIHVNAKIDVKCEEVYFRLRFEWTMVLLRLLGLVCAFTIDASFSPFSACLYFKIK